LQTIPRIAPISATDIVCAVGDSKQFKRGRDLTAWRGLTLRQQSSGGKDKLLEISKRGDSYPRTLLNQGANSVLKVVGNKTNPRSLWLQTFAQEGLKP